MLASPGASRRAPDFTLEQAGGGSVRLDDYAGRFRVLVFLPGAACPACRAQLRGLAARYAEFRRRGAEVFAVGCDPPETLRSLQEELKIPFSLLSDPEARVVRAYGLLDPHLALAADTAADDAAAAEAVPPVPPGAWRPRPASLVIDDLGYIRYAYLGEIADGACVPAPPDWLLSPLPVSLPEPRG